MYQVIARKYRPQSFGELIGQEHVRTTIENAITQKRIAHGYIFSGQRGTGKTTVARILGRCLNCIQGPTITPCGVCASCLEITGGNALGVDLFLAADTAHPQDLATNFPTLVVAGSTFNYAIGTLVFWSNTSNVDVTCATGSCGYNASVYSKVAIANPSTAPLLGLTSTRPYSVSSLRLASRDAPPPPPLVHSPPPSSPLPLRASLGS